MSEYSLEMVTTIALLRNAQWCCVCCVCCVAVAAFSVRGGGGTTDGIK